MPNDLDDLILEVELLRTAIRVHDSGTTVTCYSIADWQTNVEDAYRAELTRDSE